VFAELYRLSSQVKLIKEVAIEMAAETPDSLYVLRAPEDWFFPTELSSPKVAISCILMESTLGRMALELRSGSSKHPLVAKRLGQMIEDVELYYETQI
jgi:hypothetical protein